MEFFSFVEEGAAWTWYIELEQISLVIYSLKMFHLPFCILLKADFPDSITANEFSLCVKFYRKATNKATYTGVYVFGCVCV
jgi:hypothetical protein